MVATMIGLPGGSFAAAYLAYVTPKRQSLADHDLNSGPFAPAGT